MEINSLEPLIVIPGLAGTNLDFSLNANFNEPSCNVKALNALQQIQPGLWVNPVGLLLQKECILELMRPRYNEVDNSLNNLPGLNVFPKGTYFGDPLSSICLAYILKTTTKCYPFTNYSKNFVEYFINKGYKSGYDLFITGYDFRLVPFKEYGEKFFSDLQMLIETTRQKTGKRIHLVGHSLGTLLGNMFLNKMSKKWKKIYIKDFISISPSYDGAPKALRSALSGYNFGLPDFIKVANNDFTFAERSMAGLAATIPLLPGMYGEIKCDSKYKKGDGTAVTILFGTDVNNKEKIYNVNNYEGGTIEMIKDITQDVNKYNNNNTENTKYLDVLTKIMKPIAKERKKYAYSDPGVQVYQLIARPVTTEVSYLYDSTVPSKTFTENPLFTTNVVGDEDIPIYGANIPQVFHWKNVTDKIFPPLDGLDHFTLYTDSTIAYDYVYSIISK